MATSSSTASAAVPPPHDALAAFVDDVRQAIAEGAFVSLVLSKPRHSGGESAVRVRLIALKEVPALSFVATHATRDVTRNLDVGAGVAEINALLDAGRATSFAHATLHAAGHDTQLLVSKKGKATLRRHVDAERAHQRHCRGARGRRARRARPRARAPPADRAAVPRRARPHRFPAPAGAVDGAQVAPDRQVPRGSRSRARRIAGRDARRRRGADPRRRLRRRQGLSDLRRPRASAPALRRRARGDRRRAASRPGRFVQRRRRALGLPRAHLRRGRPAQRRATGGRRDDRAARLRHRDRSRDRPRRAGRRRDPRLLAVLPQESSGRRSAGRACSRACCATASTSARKPRW